MRLLMSSLGRSASPARSCLAVCLGEIVARKGGIMLIICDACQSMSNLGWIEINERSVLTSVLVQIDQPSMNSRAASW